MSISKAYLGEGKGKNPPPPQEIFEKFYIIFTCSFYLIISELRIKEEKRAQNFPPPKKILGAKAYLGGKIPPQEIFEKIYIIFTYSFYLIISKLRTRYD